MVVISHASLLFTPLPLIGFDNRYLSLFYFNSQVLKCEHRCFVQRNGGLTISLFEFKIPGENIMLSVYIIISDQNEYNRDL